MYSLNHAPMAANPRTADIDDSWLYVRNPTNSRSARQISMIKRAARRNDRRILKRDLQREINMYFQGIEEDWAELAAYDAKWADFDNDYLDNYDWDREMLDLETYWNSRDYVDCYDDHMGCDDYENDRIAGLRPDPWDYLYKGVIGIDPGATAMHEANDLTNLYKELQRKES